MQTEVRTYTAEELKQQSKKRVALGAVMLLAMPFLPITVYLTQYIIPRDLMLLVFIGFGGVGIVGMVILGYFGRGYSMFAHSIELLKKLAPPEPMIFRRIAVIQKEPAYVVGQFGSNIIMFIAFIERSIVPHEDFDIPQVVWKWDYDLEVAGLKLARKEGAFSIPVDPMHSHRGEGVLYSLMTETGFRHTTKKDYAEEQLNEIIDHLVDEVSPYGSV
ncbi:hypothetical protein EU546_00295 [Candidatus Thorarchaeota archaeon]|nr:MAG: hypothetical protein EU546_00295 [Candidatus Thorarchaeota archaeon]